MDGYNIFAEGELAEFAHCKFGQARELPFVGLTVFKGDRPVKSEVTVAKNYMTEKELFALRRMRRIVLHPFPNRENRNRQSN